MNGLSLTADRKQMPNPENPEDSENPKNPESPENPEDPEDSEDPENPEDPENSGLIQQPSTSHHNLTHHNPAHPPPNPTRLRLILDTPTHIHLIQLQPTQTSL